MYEKLGSFVARRWIVVILLWIAAAAAIKSVAPSWDEVSKDGDLAYLPAETTTVRGQKLYGEAFPDNKSRSDIVVVLERPAGLVQADLDFAQQIADFFDGHKHNFAQLLAENRKRNLDTELAVVDVMRPAGNLEGQTKGADDLIGQKLIAPDKKAAIVVASLEHELIAVDSAKMLRLVEKVVNQKLAEARGHNHKNPLPEGLNWGLTGSAAVGADTLIESDKSIEAIHFYTAGLVVVILMIVYRAPVLVLVPLVTIGVSVFFADNLVALLTQLQNVPGFGWFRFDIFKTSKIFTFTICFGSGTDFCLFLISRYKEELERGLSKADAMRESLGQVGHALTGSAMTTVCGLGMMYFAQFGKFTYCGPTIALCLIVTLIGCLTLAPALLRGFGRLVYWPFGLKIRKNRHEETEHDSLLDRFWAWTSVHIVTRPGLILVTSFVLMAPLAVVRWDAAKGEWKLGFKVGVSYDLLADLPSETPSRVGTEMMERHFPAGEMGPITIFAKKDGYQFDSEEGRREITKLTKEIWAAFPTQVTGVRCLTYPLGDKPPEKFGVFGGLRKGTLTNHEGSKSKYVSMSGPRQGTVTRFDVVTAYDPFSIEAENLLGPSDVKLREEYLRNGTPFLENFLAKKTEDPQSFWFKGNDPNNPITTFDCIGTTAGTRDLKAVTASDEVIIQSLTVIAVTGVVLFLLRRPLICGYLIFTVVFSYLVTLGATDLFFHWLYPEFPGLDWKVPIFLFVILVAVGEDYNIYLATRIFEEERRLGRIKGLQYAIVRTGGIITSCGVIMAGTFVALMSGSLRAIFSLGFALTVGVVLDTFIVRPVLVPAFLAWLYRIVPEKAKAGITEAALEVAEVEGGVVTVPGAPHTDRTRRSVKR